MRVRLKRKLAFVAVIAIIVSNLTWTSRKTRKQTVKAATDYGIQNPIISNGVTIWDCIYFGNYWQNDTNGDGIADKSDNKEPIKWRVLSVDGDDAFLLADKNLDVQRYHDVIETVTWENCTMRSWLNGYGAESNVCGTDYTLENFMDYAFTSSEQSVILNTLVVNEDNPDSSIEGGNNTTDKIYFLSNSEVNNISYGFSECSPYRSSKERVSINTIYAAEGGEIDSIDMPNGGSNNWWLRSPGEYGHYASYVDYNGVDWSAGQYVRINNISVRPVLHLDLSATLTWNYAGTINSEGVVKESEEENEPTSVPTITPASSSTPSATVKPNTTAKPSLVPDSTNQSNQTGTEKSTLKKGFKFTKSSLKYKVTKLSKTKGSIAVIDVRSKKIKKVTIPRVVNRDGVTLQVTEIGKGAFKNCKKLKKVTIRSKTIKKIGKKAFAKIPKKTRFIVPKSKIKKYSKMIKKAR